MECTLRPSGTVRLPGDQGLRQDLAAEDALPGLLLRRAHEDVFVRPGALQLTEVQELEERGGGVLGGQPLQSGFGFSHGLTLDVTPAPLKRGTTGRVHIVSDVLTQPLQFTDPRDLADLRTFATRAKSIDDGAIRLQASGPVLAAYVCVLRPRLLGESTPTILGLRTMALAQPAETDVTVPLSAVLDRLARAGENDVELPLPPVNVTESWAGVGAPRGGWELLGALQDAELRQAAEAGITEVAAIMPDKPGALIVNNARAAVWGRELPGRRRASGRCRLRGAHPGIPGRRRTAALPRRPLVPAQRHPRARPGPHRHRLRASPGRPVRPSGRPGSGFGRAVHHGERSPLHVVPERSLVQRRELQGIHGRCACGTASVPSPPA